ncbi:unnamed protein product, partial [Amoebophrya sp. A25]
RDFKAKAVGSTIATGGRTSGNKPKGTNATEQAMRTTGGRMFRGTNKAMSNILSPVLNDQRWELPSAPQATKVTKS